MMLKGNHMSLVSNVLVAIVALLHFGFLYLEMFLWDKPAGRRVFRTTEAFAKESKTLAANQGLYNGFLAAGLVWGLFSGDDVRTFFLICVLIAGIFGAFTVSKRVLYIQALPALFALALLVVF